MGSHPVNLALRFLMELSALMAMAYWGWQQSDSALRIVFALGVPIVAAAVWGTLAVPGDPSRSGSAPPAGSWPSSLGDRAGVLFVRGVGALRDWCPTVERPPERRGGCPLCRLLRSRPLAELCESTGAPYEFRPFIGYYECVHTPGR